MNKKMKRIIAIAVPVIVIAATIITVVAYLQNSADQSNRFTIGQGDAKVTEVFTEPATMAMTNELQKVVKVKNTGTSDQFVRAYLDFSDSRIRDMSRLAYTENGSSVEQDWNHFIANLPENWTYIPENTSGDEILGGYFYYTKILSPGEETDALIEKVVTTFGNDGNTDRITDFDIVVYSESVQTTEITAQSPTDPTDVVYGDADWKAAWKSFLALSA